MRLHNFSNKVRQVLSVFDSKPFIIFFLLLLSNCPVFAQQYNFKVYSVSDGLPQAMVHDLTQTDDGYIWMATYGGGLVRFDGKHYKSYTMEDGLRDNSVEQILKDSNDNIWVATSKGGVATFRGDSLVYPIKSDSLDHYGVTGMDEINGKLWLGTYQGGVFIYDGQHLSRLTKADGLPSNTVWDFFKGSDGQIWMATQKGIAIYDESSIKSYTKKDGLSGRKIYKIIQKDNGQKWIATNNGITLWDGKKFKTITSVNGNPLESVFDVMESSDGKIWIGTEVHGVYVYTNGHYRHLTKENGLSSNYIYKFFEDKDHHIWIATDEDGVNLYKGDGFVFYNEHTGLKSNSILKIYRDNNGVFWLGTTDGFESFDGVTVTQYPLPKHYSNKNIWNITGLPNGDKLIAMPDNSLMEFDGHSYTDFLSKYGLKNLYVYYLYVDSTNHLWVCADDGLYKFSLEKRKYKKFTADDGLADNTVYYIYEDSSGTKWIGTLYGLSIYDGNHFKNVRVADGLGHDEVYYITKDKRDNMWLGTGGGVTEYKPTTDSKPAEIHNFDQSDGMELVKSHFLWFDEDGYLWQGTNGGLQMLDVPNYRKTGKMNITHYALSRKGMGLEFNSHAISYDGHEKAWLGSMEGIVQLNPNRIKRVIAPPTINLTKVTLNSLPVKWKDYRDTLHYHNGTLQYPSISFPYGQNVYGFKFSGLSYFNPDNVKYRYKLEGFEDDWMPITKNNSATYTNLGTGDYTFVVEAKNGEGNFSSKASYSFSVAYPFWRTYWFYGMVIFGLVGMVFLYTRIRIHYLEKNRLKELVDEQTEDLQKALEEKEVLVKEIHHRVKNNLAVISGLFELQVDYSDDEFATKILRESQRRIQSISMIHEKLYQNERLAEIDFSKYIKELVDVITYSNSKTDNNIDVEISTGNVKLGVNQGIPCGLIINELISNAYEHAFEGREEGKVWITFEELEETKIKLSVKDNGIGLPADFEEKQQESQSLGMVLVETLARQLSGDMEIRNLAQGVEFIIEFEKENPTLKIPVEN